MSGRGFDFNGTTRAEVRRRQRYVCAHCGRKDTGKEDFNVHHVIPDQAGGDKNNPDHAFLRTTLNGVALCHQCHVEVHEDGKYKHGALPYSFKWYQYSHGKKRRILHLAWIEKLEKLAPLVWSKFSK